MLRTTQGISRFARRGPDPFLYAADLERMAEIALLISLFAVGLKLGVPLRDKRWYLPSVLRDQRILISWFGIRGVGSIFYLMYAINHGLPKQLASELIAITLTTVTASILFTGFR